MKEALRRLILAGREVLEKPSGILMLGTFGGYGLALVTATIQARILGPVGRGEVGTAAAPGAVLGVLLCLNLPDYFGRRAALRGDTRMLAAQALVLGTVTGLIFFLPYVVFASLWQRPGSTIWWLLVAFALITPISTFGNSLSAIAVGSDHWRLAAFAKLLPGSLGIIGLSIAGALDSGPLTVGLVMIGSGLAGLLLPLTLQALRPDLAAGRVGTEWFSYSRRAWPAGAIALLSQRVDLLLVAAIASSAEVGYYTVATSLAAVLTAVSNAIAIPTRNAVARGDAFAAAHRAAVAIWATVALCVAGVAASWPFIHVFLGAEFKPALLPTALLMAAEIPLAGAVVLNQSLLGAGLPDRPLAGAVAALLVTGIGVAASYPFVGLAGAATACIAGSASNLALQMHAVRRDLIAAPVRSFLIPSTRPGHRGSR